MKYLIVFPLIYFVFFYKGEGFFFRLVDWIHPKICNLMYRLLK